MGKAQTNEKHPKGFYACCITFMFERLAFYGAKPILLLFLITATLQGGIGIERTDAAVMAANLTAYTYMAPLIGGIISDRWLGARYAISLLLLYRHIPGCAIILLRSSLPFSGLSVPDHCFLQIHLLQTFVPHPLL